MKQKQWNSNVKHYSGFSDIKESRFGDLYSIIIHMDPSIKVLMFGFV